MAPECSNVSALQRARTRVRKRETTSASPDGGKANKERHAPRRTVQPPPSLAQEHGPCPHGLVKKRRGPNPHNVSVTVSYKKEEQNQIADWMIRNKANFSGVSLLPDDGGTYLQAPFSSISEKEYKDRLARLPEKIDLSLLGWGADTGKDERFIDWACAGDSCEPG